MNRPSPFLKTLQAAGLLLLAATSQAGTVAPLIINEVDYDQVNSDTAEFIELKANASLNLSTYQLQLVNGSNDSVYATIILPDVPMAAGQYYVVCTNTATTPNCDLDGNGSASTDLLQNGAPDGIRLARVSGNATVDAMSYEGNMTCCTEGLPVTQADDNVTAHIGLSRFADGTDTNSNANDFSLRCISPGSANIPTTSSCAAPSASPSLSINDVTVTEGNAGTVTAQFTVSLSAPAGSGGVQFDIATADGSATVADGDYLSRALTAQTIAAGASSYTFDVTVQGDSATEAHETFSVQISNVSGATLGDGQGIGTILSDDGVLPTLSVLAPPPTPEGTSGCSAGRTPFTFTISADTAPTTDLDITWSTSDGSAQDGNPSGEDTDYLAATAQHVTLSSGATSTTLQAFVLCDGDIEGNETFSVTLAPGSGYALHTASAQATIVNDDVTPISAIQGSGATSPLQGLPAVTRGVVTGRVNNGFYIQSQEQDMDADDATSEGLFVFTSSTPPAEALVGNLLLVSGTVTEFVPSSDPSQQPLTQLTAPSITVLATGAALPAPRVLTTALPSPTGGIQQLESLENMRVTADSLTVVGPTDGNVNETNATATSNGRFYAVVTGTARPFREPGIEPEDSVGLPGGLPFWDGNPEKLTIESARTRDGSGSVRPAIDVDVGATLQNATGILDYAFRAHRISLDHAASPIVNRGASATSVSAANASEFTVATYNLERFFDDQNNPAIGEPVLTTDAYQRRLNKASLMIRDHLRTPDILGIVEIEDLNTLQALAERINSDAGTAGQPNPQYVAYLVEGNDSGGIDVGFLVKTAPLPGSTAPRVEVSSVTQVGAATTYSCDGTDQVLNDRPPLVLSAQVHFASGPPTSVTAVVNHLRSMNGITDATAGCGSLTEGQRVRLKRLRQAEFLANWVQARQTSNPTERIVLLGDFNAFEFNDGYVDVMGTLTGLPTTDAGTLVPGDGADLVDPNLVNLTTLPSTPMGDRYSFVFDGNAQSLDHIVVNGALLNDAAPVRIEHARLNADFAEDNRGDAVPLRLSDHDATVAYFRAAGSAQPDLLFRNGFETP